MRVCIYILFLVLFQQTAFPQTPEINALLSKIAGCQVVSKDSNYAIGMFPSKRIYLKRKGYQREDDNIFFTGLVVWTLRQHYSLFNDHNKAVVDSIFSKATLNFPNYRNKYGDCTYNFWVPKPNRHFPNDRFFVSRTRFALPDDLDDTAILYLSTKHSDSLTQLLKSKMANNANGKKKWINNSFKRYKYDEAYNSWFGNKMDVEFDINVQCNAMRWVLDNQLPLNKYDSATIKLINKMVLANEHIKYSYFVSPQYQNVSVVLYHLARLVAIHPTFFEEIRTKLVGDIQQQMKIVKHPMEKLLLAISLTRFGISIGEKLSLSSSDFEGFYFFLANMTSVAPNPFKRWLARSKWTNFYYQSEGYYYTLLLEYECLLLKTNEK